MLQIKVFACDQNQDVKMAYVNVNTDMNQTHQTHGVRENRHGSLSSRYLRRSVRLFSRNVQTRSNKFVRRIIVYVKKDIGR